MPCRSASASLPVAMSYSPRLATRDAIAYGDEQSIRILPSQSSVMNDHCGSTALVHHRQVQPRGARRSPASRPTDAPAQRVGADLDPGVADGVDVDDVLQVADVGAGEVVEAGGVGVPGRSVVDPLDAVQPGGQQVVGPAGDHRGGIGVGGSAVGRVVLEAAVPGRVVARRDHDAVGQPAGAAAVRLEDGVRDGRGRGVAVVDVEHHRDAVGGQHLQRGRGGRRRTARGCRRR